MKPTRQMVLVLGALLVGLLATHPLLAQQCDFSCGPDVACGTSCYVIIGEDTYWTTCCQFNGGSPGSCRPNLTTPTLNLNRQYFCPSDQDWCITITNAPAASTVGCTEEKLVDGSWVPNWGDPNLGATNCNGYWTRCFPAPITGPGIYRDKCTAAGQESNWVYYEERACP